MKKHLCTIVLSALVCVMLLSAVAPAFAGLSIEVQDSKRYAAIPEGEVYERDLPNMRHTYFPWVLLDDGRWAREVTVYVNGAYQPVLVLEDHISFTHSWRYKYTTAVFRGTNASINNRYVTVRFNGNDEFSHYLVPWQWSTYCPEFGPY